MGRGRGRGRGWVTKKATTNNGRPAGLQNGDNAQPAQAKTNGHTHHPPTSHGMNKPSKSQPRKSMAVDSACQAQAQSADQRDNGQTCPPDATHCQKKPAKKQQQRKSTSEGLDGTTQKAVTAKASHESDAQTTQAHIAMGQTMPQAADGQLSNGHAYQPGFLQDQKSQPKPEENVSTSADVHHNAVTAHPKNSPVRGGAPKSQTDSAVSQSHQGADSPCSNGHAYQTGALCKKPPSNTPRRKSSSEGQSVTQQSAESAKYNRENGGQRRRANSAKSQSASQYRYYSKRQSREQPKQCGMTNTAPLQGPTAADSSVSCQPPLSLNIEALSQSTNWDTLDKVQKASMIMYFSGIKWSRWE
ncbi:hypothetical protein EGW08_011268 [Elysia chlorotica]|uniref:Uncharacterized protein n=1 Tax=Elysia chlorotica TaxID=188477 RepID=A0A3S1C2C5_ELYCH|nr:hypothetical protein EGW08_011268 [Elysia chlorotica]